MMHEMSFGDSVCDAMNVALEMDPRVLCFGLGIDDPKGIFGTTLGLAKKHGSDRVFDMPTSENGMTGIAVGAALGGLIPVMTHQRLDFFMLAMDQLINNAAKWHYMFGGANFVPLTIRLIVGRGWGQGPTHSQSLHSCFAHIPGLKVLLPTTPRDARGMLLSAIFDPNPVLIIEHRWLHQARGLVPKKPEFLDLGKAALLTSGNDFTVVSHSIMTPEALRAEEFLKRKGISIELIDLKSLVPLDFETIRKSVRKTGRLLVLDSSHKSFSYAAEIISRISEEEFANLRTAPARLCLPDFPTPTSFYLTNKYYPGAREVVELISNSLNLSVAPNELGTLESHTPHDVPGPWFKGPF